MQPSRAPVSPPGVVLQESTAIAYPRLGCGGNSLFAELCQPEFPAGRKSCTPMKLTAIGPCRSLSRMLPNGHANNGRYLPSARSAHRWLKASIHHHPILRPQGREQHRGWK